MKESPVAVPDDEDNDEPVTHPEETITETHPEGEGVDMIVGDPPPTP